ncbi:helix-turn-helix transcriptional regulator [Virgibacillus soli]|uniref:Helix-turn-helix domain-containing protein n=1 Tax=Paracerasibacillus soli TaxID=480284 RepID=A0ABU5CRJ1_9BACI|nr:helix-turn-helix domain-containing protein [Virgibacillus soli]MDY0408434.1 helix-turn-helix domain-containing protein [Virgibacillus soli]
MEKTLRLTSVLSDPTRFNVYQYIVEHHKEVTVSEIAKEFNIHPNVARLHLSKLEDVYLLQSYTQKTGKGGRPSRLYCLSDQVIELNFPHRDYKLLSTLAIDTLVGLGDIGKKALYETGYNYGLKVMERYHTPATTELNMDECLQILSDAGRMLGMYPSFTYDEKSHVVHFTVNNCPFKEVAAKNHEIVCEMHHSFFQGIFESLFTDIELITGNTMFSGCENCSYTAKISNI